MIVAPNFADHWKTDLLVKITGSEEAIRCLLRFWSHCQQQKTDRFPKLTPTVLAAICRWKGDENLFWDAMTKTYVEVRENGLCIAHEWKQVNSQLVTSWKNGGLGGRPKKNPWDTRGIPVDNPRQTRGEPKPLSPPSNPSAPLNGFAHELKEGRFRFPREQKELKSELVKQLKAITTNAKNYARGPMLKDPAEVIEFHRKSPKPNSEVEIKRIQHDPANYSRGPMLSESQAKANDIRHKIMLVDQALRGEDL